ncbi:Dimeric alpha+beta barrel [Mycena sanguinolenta]|uniref:Dimeric alpha+beta barrel n=1 Tax=Mycena sanguinolenta TaxID=230812 RepID=A0A8H6Z7B0_9AGAR|nr:Dimeric alpha+beta barrel [Mycena sanguinolenta]
MAIKLTIFIKKRDDISFEEFSKYWRETHGKLFVSCGLAAKYTIKYAQYHVLHDPEVVGKLKKAGFQTLEYDGIGEFWFESLEKMEELFVDETTVKVMEPDELKFTRREEWKMMIGEVTEQYCAGERSAN